MVTNRVGRKRDSDAMRLPTQSTTSGGIATSGTAERPDPLPFPAVSTKRYYISINDYSFFEILRCSASGGITTSGTAVADNECSIRQNA